MMMMMMVVVVVGRSSSGRWEEGYDLAGSGSHTAILSK